jgi:hypothetical protein
MQMQPQPDYASAPPLQSGLTMSYDNDALDHGIVSTSYNFAHLRTLWVRLAVTSMNPVANAHIVFTNPAGETYFEIGREFSVDPNVGTMPMPNMDHDMTVFPAKVLPGGYALDVPVPIAGSAMSRFPISAIGRWTVDAKVEGFGGSLNSPLDVTYER